MSHCTIRYQHVKDVFDIIPQHTTGYDNMRLIANG